MATFEFKTKTDVSEWEVRQAFSVLHWGILWKVQKDPLEVGWNIRVYYAVLTAEVADRVWIDGWTVKRIDL